MLIEGTSIRLIIKIDSVDYSIYEIGNFITEIFHLQGYFFYQLYIIILF